MIDLDSFDVFRALKESLHNISVDTSEKGKPQYMTESPHQATSFDVVKRVYANALHHSEDDAHSVDALTQTADTIVFIEFKNGKVKNANVKSKIRDSLLIYCDITNTTISDTRCDAAYVLVYDLENNPLPNQLTKEKPAESVSRVRIASYFAKKAGNELIRFDLERFQGLYFREVHTYTKEEFDLFLQRNNLYDA